MRLPSFEQFVALAEGLNRAGSDLLSPSSTFLLGDKPGRHEHLIVQIDAGRQELAELKLIEKRRRISDTPILLNCYVANSARLQGIDNRVLVDQLYIIEDEAALI
ncbi:hypothetical protein GRI40_06275 [Altererythrobacter aerius]|uniref:Uncharacterized protein n=1 Tax=Tsuneonella aeria TaxID=1837929 RepID=A0A6I4TF76_9SPHN|nr:hypothetical protein [Tsuneonella aeria]